MAAAQSTDFSALITVANAAAFNGNTHREAIQKSIRDAAEEADANHWPGEGRYAVMSPAYYRGIQEELEEDKIFLVTGVTDNMVVNKALARYAGFEIIMDDSMPNAKTASTANHWIYFGVRGHGYRLRLGAPQDAGIRVRGDRRHAGPGVERLRRGHPRAVQDSGAEDDHHRLDGVTRA